MKKILIFSSLVFSVVFYAYFKVHLKKRENIFQNPILNEKQKPVEVYLTTPSSEIRIKLKDSLWSLVHSHHLYPADQDFVEQNLEIMIKTPTLSTFPLKEDHFGLKTPRAFMKLVYNNDSARHLIVGGTAGPKGSLYILDRDRGQIFVVHSIFGQFLYHPPSMFFHKKLPIPGESIQSLKRDKSSKTLWEVKKTDQNHARVFFENQSKKIPKKKLSLFFKKIRDFELRDHQFKKPESFKKFSSLSVETEKKSIRFDFDDKKGQFYSETQNVLAHFKPSLLSELDNELKKVMGNEK